MAEPTMVQINVQDDDASNLMFEMSWIRISFRFFRYSWA